MAGVAIEIKDEGFEKALAAIEGIERLDQTELLDGLGRFFQESTRERIDVTKTAPDGSAWKANNQGTSILKDTGNLSASIDYKAGNSSVEVGSALIYSRIHQFGGEIKPKNGKHLVFPMGNALVFATKVNIPARPYLGVSADDSREALKMVADTIAELFQ
jgi:phage virion morphogenesis protein